jgi:ribosome modulation factor
LACQHETYTISTGQSDSGAKIVSHDEFERALVAYLEAGIKVQPLEVPSQVAEADGRNARIAGYSVRTNPYKLEREPEQHKAWLRGFENIQPKLGYSYSYQQKVGLFVN